MKRELINKELNEAIFKVCTTKYKKDAKDAHETVEAYGYQITKDNGEFHVYSTLTHKSVRIGVRTRYSYKEQKNITSYRFNWDREYDFDTINKIDFVAYLTTDINEAWRKKRNNDYYSTFNKSAKYEKLQDKKRWVQYAQDEIDSIKKQMEELQKKLEREIARKVKAEQELENYKKEIGLK